MWYQLNNWQVLAAPVECLQNTPQAGEHLILPLRARLWSRRAGRMGSCVTGWQKGSSHLPVTPVTSRGPCVSTETGIKATFYEMFFRCLVIKLLTYVDFALHKHNMGKDSFVISVLRRGN